MVRAHIDGCFHSSDRDQVPKGFRNVTVVVDVTQAPPHEGVN